MGATTTRGAPYPEPGDNNNVPLDIKALAEWVNERPGVSVLTTAERDALPVAEKWLGRTIVNTTTNRRERVVGGAWVADTSTLVQAGPDEVPFVLTLHAAPNVPGFSVRKSDGVQTVSMDTVGLRVGAVPAAVDRGTLLSASTGRLQVEMTEAGTVSPAFRAYMGTTGSVQGGTVAPGPFLDAKAPYGSALAGGGSFFLVMGTTGHLIIDRRYSPNTDAVGTAMIRAIQYDADYGPPLHISKATTGDIFVVTSDGVVLPRTAQGGQTHAKIQLRSVNGGVAGAANVLEWGHNNPGGYGSVLGYHTGGGQPFIALNAEGGTTSGTYRTRGFVGAVLEANGSSLAISTVPVANADNQATKARVNVRLGPATGTAEAAAFYADARNTTTLYITNGDAAGYGANDVSAAIRFAGASVVHGDLCFTPTGTEAWRFTSTGGVVSSTSFTSVGVATLFYSGLTNRSNAALKQDVQTLDVTAEPRTKLQRLAASNPEAAVREAKVPRQRTEPIGQRMKELRAVTFRYKEDDPKRHPLRHGFIAEEIAAALPEVAVYDTGGAVVGTEDPETGEIIKGEVEAASGNVYGYDLGALVTLTVATVQDVLTRLERLEGRAPGPPLPK